MVKINIKFIGVRSYTGDNGQQFVIGPEFCGGALSKGGNAIAAESDNVGGLIKSKFVIFNKYFIPPMIIRVIHPQFYPIRLSYIIGNVFMFQTVAGGAINDVAANADDGDAVQYSANAPITGYSIRYQQSPCTGATQS